MNCHFPDLISSAACAATDRVARMVGRQDLHSRPDLRAIADRDLHDVEDHAVEVQEHASTEAPRTRRRRKPDSNRRSRVGGRRSETTLPCSGQGAAPRPRRWRSRLALSDQGRWVKDDNLTRNALNGRLGQSRRLCFRHRCGPVAGAGRLADVAPVGREAHARWTGRAAVRPPSKLRCGGQHGPSTWRAASSRQ